MTWSTISRVLLAYLKTGEGQTHTTIFNFVLHWTGGGLAFILLKQLTKVNRVYGSLVHPRRVPNSQYLMHCMSKVNWVSIENLWNKKDLFYTLRPKSSKLFHWTVFQQELLQWGYGYPQCRLLFAAENNGQNQSLYIWWTATNQFGLQAKTKKHKYCAKTQYCFGRGQQCRITTER